MNFLVFAVLVGGGLAVLGRRLYHWLRPEPSCLWCGQKSGWPVYGHDTLHCRGYVSELREQNEKYGGNIWRTSSTA
ncbi:hypothetical protein [Streptomyces filamentosus]|uniref:hypothetical protein n=1 Tax=Streptomyces filamentosus TaxID=67294 RepID=UPI0033F374A2